MESYTTPHKTAQQTKYSRTPFPRKPLSEVPPGYSNPEASPPRRYAELAPETPFRTAAQAGFVQTPYVPRDKRDPRLRQFEEEQQQLRQQQRDDHQRTVYEQLAKTTTATPYPRRDKFFNFKDDMQPADAPVYDENPDWRTGTTRADPLISHLL